MLRSADIGSDHFLLCTAVKLKLMKVRKKERKSNRTRFDTDKLKHAETRNKCIVSLKNKYQALENHIEEPTGDEIEDECKILERCYIETAKKVLGKKRKKKKPWISETTWRLIDQRADIHKKILATHSDRLKGRLQDLYREKDREIKRQVRNDKRQWMGDIAIQAQEAARHQNMRTLYGLTKKLCNDNRPNQSVAIEDKDGKLVNGKEETLRRWNEHFKEILNREVPVRPITEEHITEPPIIDINTSEPSYEEVRNAIRNLKSGKASGIDSITAELLKADIEFSTRKVMNLLEKIWNKEEIPETWRKGLTIKLPKKGNLKKCKNWRGITLLQIISCPGKNHN